MTKWQVIIPWPLLLVRAPESSRLLVMRTEVAAVAAAVLIALLGASVRRIFVGRGGMLVAQLVGWMD